MKQISSTRLSDLVGAFSMTLDLIENTRFSHSKRVMYLCMRMAKVLELSQKEVKDLYVASSLHDLGIGLHFDMHHISPPQIRRHALVGSKLIEHFSGFEHLSELILFHHEAFDGSGPFERRGDDIPLLAQMIACADFVEFAIDNQEDYGQNQERVISLLDRENHRFRPDLYQMMRTLLLTEGVWFDLENIHEPVLLDRWAPPVTMTLDLPAVVGFATNFSKILDNRNEFTFMHSLEMAEKTTKVLTDLAYDPETIQRATVAALLHDLGKVVVPTSLLDKPGPLTEKEYQRVKQHPYYSEQVLRRIGGFSEIARWAGRHHERIDGSGYPWGLGGSELSQIDQILGILDSFQALIEDRPYRGGLAEHRAWKILYRDAEQGVYDKHLIDVTYNALQR